MGGNGINHRTARENVRRVPFVEISVVVFLRRIIIRLNLISKATKGGRRPHSRLMSPLTMERTLK